jgi:hypothetical protein
MMRCVWSAAIVVVCAFACDAQAQAGADTAGDKAAAEALFDEGRKLMAERQYTQACAKFQASQGLDPGVGTLLNLADCFEKAGRTASAWAQFRETISAAHKAGSAERERVARQRAQQLEPKLSYLTIVTSKQANVSVTRDGVEIEAAVLDTAIPIDPGTHVIAASGEGKRSWSSQVSVGEQADHASITIPVLADEPIAPPPMAAVELPAPPPTTAVSQPVAERSSGDTQRVVAVVAAAIGVVGVATGTVFGIKAASSLSDAKTHCDPYPHCAGKGAELAKDAQNSGTISTIAFIVGGVGLVSGAILWFSAPDGRADARHDASAALDVGPGTIMLHGRF